MDSESDAEGSFAFESEDEGHSFDDTEDMELTTTSVRTHAYNVLSEEQLGDRQQEVVQQLTSVLAITDSEAARVLRLFNWDVNRAKEEWFTDTDSLRDKVGLVDARPTPKASSSRKKVQCKICFEDHPRGALRSAACGRHPYCLECWRGFVSEAVRSGPAVLDLRCPDMDCRAAVGKDLLEEVAAAPDRERYARYALRSFVDDNRQLAWCPAPGCEHAVEALQDQGAGEALDVACRCGASFCFNCRQEAHRPVGCKTVEQWLRKNTAESENLNWILAHTKECPRCKRPIEKNQGCMHMTCSQCRHEFCWLCSGDWKDHGERTGGFYSCNKYESAKQKGEYDQETLQRERAKRSLERYMHYYQRWAENDRARLAARKVLADSIEQQLERLSEYTATPTSLLRFIPEAWAQVVECRRVLKWTYAYGFYHFGEAAQESAAAPESLLQQQHFFEFNQGQAEAYLEKLHSVVERDLTAFIEDCAGDEATVPGEAPPPAVLRTWVKFRETLIGLTDVTKTHFEKLVQELERGLGNLAAEYGGAESLSRAPSAAECLAPEGSTQGSGGAGAAAGGSGRGPAGARGSKRTRGAAASRAPEPPPEQAPSAGAVEQAQGFWACPACTFANTDLARDVCAVCESERNPD